MIRIGIVDDHPIVRDGLAAVLATQSDFAVVAQADDGTTALRAVAAHRPDVLLLDLEMPGMDGVAVLRALPGLGEPLPGVIVFTAFDTDERIVEAVRAGARGYLLKGAPREELFNAIRVVHAGGSLLQPVVATRLMQRLGRAGDPDALTPREVEVLRLLAEGCSNRAIAGRLVVTERTAKFHVSSILAKLGAANRTEAVAVARRRGLLEE
jgi:DNA-binding NarL/FixJ family response regulator